jgi:hypothetical protein
MTYNYYNHYDESSSKRNREVFPFFSSSLDNEFQGFPYTSEDYALFDEIARYEAQGLEVFSNSWIDSSDSEDFDQYFLNNLLLYKEVEDLSNQGQSQLRQIQSREYEEYRKYNFGVVDNKGVLIDERLCRSVMRESWDIDRNPNNFDALRVALKRSGIELVPADKFSTEEKKLICLEEILAEYFEVPCCHTVKVYPHKIVVYGDFGEKETDNVLDFSFLISHFIYDNDAGLEMSRYDSVFNPDDNPDYDFAAYLEQETGFDFSSDQQEFGPNMNPELNFHGYEATTNVSVLGQFAIQNFLSSDIHLLDEEADEGIKFEVRQNYNKAMMSDVNLALNAIVHDWQSYFLAEASGDWKKLSRLYERLSGLVYLKNKESEDVSKFLSSLNFRLYFYGSQAKIAKKILSVVSNYSKRGIRCTYKYPNLYAHVGKGVFKIYDLPLNPIGKLDLSRNSHVGAKKSVSFQLLSRLKAREVMQLDKSRLYADLAVRNRVLRNSYRDYVRALEVKGPDISQRKHGLQGDKKVWPINKDLLGQLDVGLGQDGFKVVTVEYSDFLDLVSGNFDYYNSLKLLESSISIEVDYSLVTDTSSLGVIRSSCIGSLTFGNCLVRVYVMGIPNKDEGYRAAASVLLHEIVQAIVNSL